MIRDRKEYFRHHKSSLFKAESVRKYEIPKLPTTPSIHRRFTCRINDFYFNINHPLLTNPSEPFHNCGFDNVDYDLIVRKNFVFGDRYKVESYLGRGVFGIVYRCLDVTTGEHVAIKIVRSKPGYSEQSETETKILSRLRHSHYVVNVLSTFTECNHRFIVFELLPYSIFRLLKGGNFQGFGMFLLSRLSKHILKGINDLHRHTVIHTDVKPENIMLTFQSVKKFDKKNFIRIIDFSNALDFSELRSHMEDGGSNALQSRFYRSPEVFFGCSNTISEKLDLWSYGVMVFELYKGRPLFSGSDDYQIIEKMIQTMGPPPEWMIRNGKFSSRFFRKNGELRSEEEYRLQESLSGNQFFRVNEDIRPLQPTSPLRNQIGLKERIMEHVITQKSNNDPNHSSSSSKDTTDKLDLVDFLEMFIQWDPAKRRDAQDGLRHKFLHRGMDGKELEEKNKKKKKTKSKPYQLEDDEEEELSSPSKIMNRPACPTLKIITSRDDNEMSSQRPQPALPPRQQSRCQITFSVEDMSGDVMTRKRKKSFSSFMDNDDAIIEVVRKDREIEKQQRKYIQQLQRQHILHQEEVEGEMDEFEDNDLLSTSSSSYTSVGSATSTASSITRGLGMMMGGLSPSSPASPTSFDYPYDYFGETSYQQKQQNGRNGNNESKQEEKQKVQYYHQNRQPNNRQRYDNDSHHRTVSVPSTMGKFRGGRMRRISEGDFFTTNESNFNNNYDHPASFDFDQTRRGRQQQRGRKKWTPPSPRKNSQGKNGSGPSPNKSGGRGSPGNKSPDNRQRINRSGDYRPYHHHRKDNNNRYSHHHHSNSNNNNNHNNRRGRRGRGRRNTNHGRGRRHSHNNNNHHYQYNNNRNNNNRNNDTDDRYNRYNNKHGSNQQHKFHHNQKQQQQWNGNNNNLPPTSPSSMNSNSDHHQSDNSSSIGDQQHQQQQPDGIGVDVAWNDNIGEVWNDLRSFNMKGVMKNVGSRFSSFFQKK